MRRYAKAGDPATEPELMLKLLFLEFLYYLSDEEVVARASTDLAVLWFLSLFPDHEVPEARQIANGAAKSTTDTDARFGRKGPLGYQQQLAMTEANEIIGVRVTPGDEPDVAHLVPLVEEIDRITRVLSRRLRRTKGMPAERTGRTSRGRG